MSGEFPNLEMRCEEKTTELEKMSMFVPLAVRRGRRVFFPCTIRLGRPEGPELGPGYDDEEEEEESAPGTDGFGRGAQYLEVDGWIREQIKLTTTSQESSAGVEVDRLDSRVICSNAPHRDRVHQ